MSAHDRSYAADAAPAETPVSSTAPHGASAASQDWRTKLNALADAGALTPAQEADFFRLLQGQETELRETMQRLLSELKPHFDTEREAEAKERFTRELQALKRKQEEDVSRLLASMGVESRPPDAA